MQTSEEDYFLKVEKTRVLNERTVKSSRFVAKEIIIYDRFGHIVKKITGKNLD